MTTALLLSLFLAAPDARPSLPQHPFPIVEVYGYVIVESASPAVDIPANDKRVTIVDERETQNWWNYLAFASNGTYKATLLQEGAFVRIKGVRVVNGHQSWLVVQSVERMRP